MTIAVQAGRFRYPPEGLFGGEPGANARFLINGEPGDPSSLTQCGPGDTVEFHSAGGGGFGDPLERDPEKVKWDVLEGLVSVERARTEYGVAIDPETFEIDKEETATLRSKRNA